MGDNFLLAELCPLILPATANSSLYKILINFEIKIIFPEK